jgi:zinc/manganese transport system substrate-binding protein
MKKLILIFAIFISNITFAKLKVVTTTPDIAWLVNKIGADKVETFSLLEGNEDPHYVDAMPHWISKVSNADVFCFVGMDLEVGWAPKILSKSGNAKVQPGGKGYCNAGSSVKALEVPTGNVDRSMGDVHAGGNPHYHLGPSYFLQSADSILSVLIEVDSKNTEYYLKNLDLLTLEIKKLKAEVESILKTKQNLKIMSYHREFSYFFKDFGLTSIGEIEETPGVPPSAGRIARVSISAKRDKVNLVLATTTNPKKLLNKFNEISKVPVAIVPLSILKSQKKSNYENLIISLAKKIVEKAN